jgi:hypothetical protein
MALPRQLPTGYDAGPIVGPFIGTDGDAYFVAKDDAALSVDVLKSANPSTTAFTAQDTANNPTSSGDIRGTTGIADLDAFVDPIDADVLHVAVLSYTTPAMGDWTWYWDYFSYTMDDGATGDAWDKTTITKAVHSAAVDSALTTGQIRIMRRSYDNAGDTTYDIVIVGKGIDAPDMGNPFDTIYHGYWDADNVTPAWTTPTRIDTGTAGAHYRYPTLSNDYTTDGDYTVTWAAQVDGRAVEGLTHTHNATEGAIGSPTAPSQSAYSRTNIVYNDSGTWRGTLIQLDVSGGNQLRGYRYDPTSSTPFSSETSENDITGADVPRSNGALLCYDPASDTRYVVYVVEGTPDSIKYVSSVSEATWGDITSHSTPANDTQLIYGRAVVADSPVDGGTVIAFLYYDATAGTAYYDEISLATGASYSITGDVTVGTTIAATMDYDLNASITGDVTVATTIAATTDYTFGRELTGDVTVALTVASGIEFGHTQAGDVTLALAIAAAMDYDLNASITSDLTLALAIAAAMDYDLNASITGDVTVPTTIAATMEYTPGGFEIVGDVTVPTTIASAMTFGHTQAGDVTLALTVASTMDYDLNASIAGDVTVSAVPASDATFGHVQAGDVTLGLTIAAAMDYDLNASITSDVTVSTTIAATMLYTPAGFEITGDVTVGLTVAAAMDYDLNASLAGDVALALTIASAMDYDLNASLVGDVTVPTTVASTITFGHVQTGDVTLALTIASGMAYTPFGGYEIVGDVTVGLTIGAMTIFILDGALDGRIDLTGSITRDLTLASSVTADVGLTATITPEPTLTDPEVV